MQIADKALENQASQVTPKTVQSGSSHESPEERNVALARETVDAELRRMRDLIGNMKVATERQKNCSMVVKNGLTSLEASLDVIESMRTFFKVSIIRLKEASDSATQAPSPPAQPAPTASFAEAVGKGKRQASSPPTTTREDKRPKAPSSAPDGELFRKVLSKKEKKKARAQEKKADAQLPQRRAQRQEPSKKKGKARPAAVIIKPSDGKSYADVLGMLRSDVKPADTGADIRAVRKTRTGDVLVELGPGTKSKSDFGAALQTTLGATATVRCLEPKSTVELRDLDELTTEDEVKSILNQELGKAAEATIFVSKANARGQKMAHITLPVTDAETLLKKGRIKIGWVSCRIRAKLVVPRCFKCLGYGHVAVGCTGPDRSKHCFKCGSLEHMASSCKEKPSCVLCKKQDSPPTVYQHVPGSSRCRAYREALEKQKTRRR